MMNKQLQSLLPRIAGAVLVVLSAAGCCISWDQDYNNVTPPEVVMETPSIEGYITNKAGTPIAGATVTVGTQKATTDETGYYIIENVAPGEYPVTVTATDYLNHTGEVTVKDPKGNYLMVKYSTTLAKLSNRTFITVSAAGGEGEVMTEFLEFNERACIEMEATVEPGTVDSSVEFYLTPIYDESEAVNSTKADTRAAAGDHLMVGVNLGCNNPNVVLQKPIHITFHVDIPLTDEATMKHYVNGEWVEIAFTAAGGNIQFDAPALGSYAIFLPFIFREQAHTQSLVFNRYEWDNLYGDGAITADEASYVYYIGTQLKSTATDVLSALLIEKIAYEYGIVYQQLEGVYPLNVRLPIGTRLVVSGTQNVTDVYAEYATWSVRSLYFGETSIVAKTTNRQHNGGSN